MMRLILTVCVGLSILGVAGWVLSASQAPNNSPIFFVIFVVFMIPPIGGLWMVYVSIRYETRPWPMILLALLPYSFVWYYFERYRLVKPDAPGSRPAVGP